MFKNMTTGKKISWAVGAVLTLLVIVSIVAIFALSKANSGFTQYRGWARDANLAGRVQANILMCRMNVKDYLMTASQKDLDQFDEYKDKTLEFLKTADEEIQNPERVKLVDAVITDFETYRGAHEKMVEHMKDRYEHLDKLNKLGPDLENALSEIMESAEKDNDMKAGFVAATAQKHLLLARLYTVKFLDENLKSQEERVLEEFGKMQKQLDFLDAELQNARRREILKDIVAKKREYMEEADGLFHAIYDRNKIVKSQMDSLGPIFAKNIEDVKLSIKADQDDLGPRLQSRNKSSVIVTIIFSVFAILIGVVLTVIIVQAVGRTLRMLISQVVGVSEKVQAGNTKERADVKSVEEEFQPVLSNVNVLIDNVDEALGKSNEALAQAEAAGEYTDALLKNIGAPMIVTDENLQIVSLNMACEKATGYSAADAVGKMSCMDLRDSSDGTSAQYSIRNAISSRSLVLGETNVKRKSGELFPVLTVCSPIIDKSGKVLGGIEILTDQTEQKETLHMVATLIDAAKIGDLSQRADIGTSSGDYKALREGINEMLDSIVNPINEASQVLDKAAQKELSARVKGEYKGAFEELKQNINQALSNIDSALQQVNVASEQVAAASGQISSGAQSLSQGSSEQASSLEEISASMEEMGAQTKQNASNANEATKVASESNKYATNGADAMEKMSEAMQRIKTSSNETAKIIKTIDEIATQTNLLALNAAVEAARAGEAGQGFAVVADEVRNLAQRSAEAAKDTANMIEESMGNAQNGVDIANDVAAILGDIKDSSKKVSDFVEEISAASSEQSRGIQQINEAVTQMNHVTQTNAANAEESASSAEELSSQAAEMRTMVGAFTLSNMGQGNAAIEFVPKQAPMPVLAKPTNGGSHNGMAMAMAEKRISADDIIPMDDDELQSF